jgi:SDR family mycofactocin-dependent oxidoreductase
MGVGVGRATGKVALVTGGARGQGRSHAIRLAEEGADVVLVDVCRQLDTVGYPMAVPADLTETALLVERLDRRAVTRQVDVREPGALAQAVAEGVAELGRLDVVVCNAGIAPLGAEVAPRAFLDVAMVNLSGVINTVHAALPHLGPGASIIATGSVAGLRHGSSDAPHNGPGGAGYGWSKTALASFVHDLARQLAPHRIRVNAVHPTNTDTDMLQNPMMYKAFRPDLDAPTRADAEPAFASMQPMGIPFVDAADVSNAVLFLASDESRYVTGLQLKVDGGCVLSEPYRGP